MKRDSKSYRYEPVYTFDILTRTLTHITIGRMYSSNRDIYRREVVESSPKSLSILLLRRILEVRTSGNLPYLKKLVV
jgi:hypothetical protein